MDLQQPQNLKGSFKIINGIILCLSFVARGWLDDKIKSRFLRIKTIILESFSILCVIEHLVVISRINFDLADFTCHFILIIHVGSYAARHSNYRRAVSSYPVNDGQLWQPLHGVGHPNPASS